MGNERSNRGGGLMIAMLFNSYMFPGLLLHYCVAAVIVVVKLLLMSGTMKTQHSLFLWLRNDVSSTDLLLLSFILLIVQLTISLQQMNQVTRIRLIRLSLKLICIYEWLYCMASILFTWLFYFVVNYVEMYFKRETINGMEVRTVLFRNYFESQTVYQMFPVIMPAYFMPLLLFLLTLSELPFLFRLFINRKKIRILLVILIQVLLLYLFINNYSFYGNMLRVTAALLLGTFTIVKHSSETVWRASY